MQTLIVIAFIAVAIASLLYRAVTRRGRQERKLTNLRRALIPFITLLVIAAMQYGAGSRPHKSSPMAKPKTQTSAIPKPTPNGHRRTTIRHWH
ncbi:MAG: hypothetical protein QOE82_3755 [Thermoanaerobaculia bacterium]|nr:hypothetical protein [Thermoanaerobaculia bacterium]